MIKRKQTLRADRPRIGLLYEHYAWTYTLQLQLQRAGFDVIALDLNDLAHDPSRSTTLDLALNRVSPSSYIRGHAAAIPMAQSYLQYLEAQGIEVINGARAFAIETDKAAQLLLLDRLGLRTPRTIIFNRAESALRESRLFPFPAVLKPNLGGSGARIHRVESHAHLKKLLEEEELLFGAGGIWLLQELIEHVSSRS